MDQNLQIAPNKFWSTVRVIYFTLRKGIKSKAKLFADLNIMMKRGKIAGKAAIHNLMMFHHSASGDLRSPDRRLSFPPNEDEFSCSNSPAPFFHLNKRNKHRSHAPPPIDGELVAAALDMMIASAAASPDLPGFGRTPMVRQLRITDSPFPLRDVDDEGNYHVDEAAEEFIMRFYNDLKRQEEMADGYPTLPLTL